MDFLPAIAFVLVAWWFSTGAILYLIGMPRLTFRLSMSAVTVAALMAIFGLWLVREDVSVGGAYAGFLCGLVVWGWHEMSFLTGYVTGPRTTDCPPGARGWRRFKVATQTVIYHEVAILVTVVLAVALTWNAPNQVGTLTLIIFWIARLSAKLNVYLGVPNLTEEFLPDHLTHLASYFRRRAMNLLLPLSVTLSTVATAQLAGLAMAAEAGSFEAASHTLLATLMALVVVEHWFLVLPIPAASMWSWGLSSRNETEGATSLATDNFHEPARTPHLDACGRTATGHV